jgi:uncharacterized membrane protein YqjE
VAKYLNPPEEPSLSELVSELTSELQLLVRNELELAKIEVSEQAKRGAKAGALGAVAAVGGLFGLLLVSFAAAWGLAEVIPAGVAFLVVGVVYLVVAAVCASKARKQVAAFKPVPQQTLTTLKDDVQVAKASLSRGASGPA